MGAYGRLSFALNRVCFIGPNNGYSNSFVLLGGPECTQSQAFYRALVVGSRAKVVAGILLVGASHGNRLADNSVAD